MNLLARVFRFLFWLLVVSWSVVLLRRFAGWILRKAVSEMPRQEASADTVNIPGTSRRLVHDPVCGMHLAEVLAIPLRDQGELVYFCSAECRDKYLGTASKSAAAGG
jgi:YHS domain-containing protein